MSTETKNFSVATKTQRQAFSKGDVILNGGNPLLWKIDTDSTIWVPALVVQGKNSDFCFIKPTVPEHTCSWYTPANADDVEDVQAIYAQREGDAESVAVFVKVAKQRPLEVDPALVEARYADNPKAIANWKEAIATPNAVRYVAIAIEEK